MQIGDVIVYIGKNHTAYFTPNRKYVVYKVRPDFVPGHTCGWILDDSDDPVYFSDDENDNAWKYIKLKDIRKEKLEKLKIYEKNY